MTMHDRPGDGLGGEVMTDCILTLDEPNALGDIVHATEFSNVKVARSIEGGHVLHGQARAIGDANGNSDFDSGVRDLYFHATLDGGSEAFRLVSGLIPEYSSDMFVIGPVGDDDDRAIRG